MAKTNELEWHYTDDRENNESGLSSRGYLVVLGDDGFDEESVKKLNLHTPQMVLARGTKSKDSECSLFVVGKEMDKDGIITPFESRPAAQAVAARINSESEIIRHQ